MFRANPRTLQVTNSNHTGTTDFVTYTCSNGAIFSADYYKTGSRITIFMETTDAQVVTSQVRNLEDLVIRYLPAEVSKQVVVAISKDGSVWEDVEVEDGVGGIKYVHFPCAGDYYVKIQRKNSTGNVYLTEIRYTYIDLSGCPNCFIYKP